MKKQVCDNFFRCIFCYVWSSLILISNSLGQNFEQNISQESPALGSPLERARSFFLAGSYNEASEIYQQAFGLDQEDGLVGASRSLAMVGNLKAAVSVIERNLTRYADLPLAATELAEVRREQGRSSEALKIFDSLTSLGDQIPLRTLVQFGDLLQFVGRREEANVHLSKALQRYNDGLVFASEDIAMVALASWRLDNFHLANSLFDEATRANPNNLEAYRLWGDLFLEKYNAADAERSYKEALEVTDRYVPALAGLARVNGDERALEKALSVNPNSRAAKETYAQLLFINGREEDALNILDEVLVINPEALKSLSLLGAKAALEEREADFLNIRERVALFSPKNPYFLGDVADTLGKQYRFEEAVVLLREALESDPQYWQGYALLGTNLIRLGEEAEGRKNLEIGFENDPFNVMTSNLLEVYDTLDTYVTLESAHFRVNMNDKDAKILWPYMEPLLEKSWDRLTQKYEFIPESPVLVQVFENRQDFAVRSVGLPDIGPLVGICFGKVITLISPDTLNANWQEIAWHEFAHVITLQMTKNKIPRWLSEGISVWEERQGQSYWGRSQGLDLVRAVNEAKLLPFASLNEGFSGAKTNADLSFAYFQSYLVIEYIASVYGFETLRSLIDQYGVVKEDETRFQIVFNLSLNEFDSHFKDWASDRAAEINVHVHKEDQPDDGEGHGHGRRENSSAILAELYNNASLKQYMNSRIEANSRDFQAHLQLGIVLFKEEDFAAAKQSLQTAYELLPTYTGYPSPPLVLAQIYEQEGDIEAQMIQLEILLENQQHDYDSALTLAKSALNSQQNGKADYYLNRALEVDPYKEEVHTLRARYAEVIGDAAMEVTEREVLLTLDVDDPVEAQTDLAEAYLKNNQWSAARASVLMALEIAPSYLRAQRLLLRTLTDEEQ